MTKLIVSRRAVTAALGAVAIGGGSAAAQGVGKLRTVPFDTAAHFDAIAKAWIVPLHAWVSVLPASSVRRAAIAALLKNQYGLTVEPAFEPVFDERINLLLADNRQAQMPVMEISAADQPVGKAAMPATGANGHSRLDYVVRATSGSDAAAPFFDVTLAGRGSAAARAQLIAPTGVSIVCDIDDTVKDTGVLDRRRLWESTFFKPFKSVAGMAALIKRLSQPTLAPVHYVSSSPWHLYEPLRSWLAADGFPVASMHLKHIRLKDSTILDIFKSPEATKPPVIGALLRTYPRRSFIFIGDSGEKDPEVYGALARQFPKQVSRILIRRVPGDQSDAARFDKAMTGLPRTLWQVFDDPTEVS